MTIDQKTLAILAAHRELIGVALALASKQSTTPEATLHAVQDALIDRAKRALENPQTPQEISDTYVAEIASTFNHAQVFLSQAKK